jgi:ligand-binding sensor domain-containing protein/signal transduction histidine kinase
MCRVILIWVLFLAVFGASGQEFNYSLRNYKAVDGLPQSQVDIMLEDANGYLWIGTHGGGLARFDGRDFKVYTTLDGLLSNIVTYLKLDSKQNLWIVHPRGLTRFDGISFTKFEQPGSPANARRVRRAFEVGDSIFVHTAPGMLGKIYKDSVYYWAQAPAPGVTLSYYHLTPDKDILLYLSDNSFWLRSRDPEKDQRFDHKKIFNRLYAMLNYRDELWLRTDSGFFTLDLAHKTFQKATLPIENSILYHDAVNDVFWTRSGTDLIKEKITPSGVTRDTVLKDTDITQVFVDQEGNTWFATQGSGLYKYNIQDFERRGAEYMNGVMAITKDRSGALWVGSMTRGLWKIKDGKTTAYVDPSDDYRNSVMCIAEAPDGAIWVGTSIGLGKYNAQADDFTWFTRDDGLSNASIINIQFDEKGGLWAGTYGGGLNYYDGKAFTNVSVKEGIITNVVMSSHYSRRYNKLFAGNEFGLCAVQNGQVSAITLPGIENTTVNSIQAFQDSLLLIGTGGAGIVVFNPQTAFTKRISTHQGLSSDFIYFVASDEKGHIWVGTEKGINRIRLDKFFDVTESLHYDYDNGLTGVETNQNAFWLGPHEKYFGLIDGFYQFIDMPERRRSSSFDLHLTDISIQYGQFSARSYSDSLSGFYKIPVNPQLPPDKNHITFFFNRVDKRYPKSVKFRYRLENFESTWSQPSSNNSVTYTNLPAGDYVFRVMSTNNQGGWTDAQIVYPFTVKTPFYQTAAFIVSAFIVLAGVILMALYLRVKQKVNKVVELERIRAREQEMLRKEIARDFHDDMGNQLTRIINYISLLKLNGDAHANGNGNGTSHHHDLYTKVETSAKYLYSGTRDFIWAIDPVNDELSKLFIYIRDFGEKLFEEKSISFRAFNEVKEKVKLPYGFSREANLIFKEAMTNAFKYSNANNVTLTLVRTATDDYELTFSDDGIGFSTAGSARADRLGAVLRITSVTGEGTKVVLAFKTTKTHKYGLAF